MFTKGSLERENTQQWILHLKRKGQWKAREASPLVCGLLRRMWPSNHCFKYQWVSHYFLSNLLPIWGDLLESDSLHHPIKPDWLDINISSTDPLGHKIFALRTINPSPSCWNTWPQVFVDVLPKIHLGWILETISFISFISLIAFNSMIGIVRAKPFAILLALGNFICGSEVCTLREHWAHFKKWREILIYSERGRETHVNYPYESYKCLRRIRNHTIPWI